MGRIRTEEDLESEHRYHEREWVVQRIGWVAMLVFIAAACAGFFGDGFLSHRKVGDASTITLRYERFARYSSPTTLEIIAARASASGEIAIEIDERYLKSFELQSIVPEPRRVESADDHFRFLVDVGALPATISIRLLPRELGSHAAAIDVQGVELRFEQFIYP